MNRENWICKNCGWKGEYNQTCTDIDGTHLCPECAFEVRDEDAE